MVESGEQTFSEYETDIYHRFEEAGKSILYGVERLFRFLESLNIFLEKVQYRNHPFLITVFGGESGEKLDECKTSYTSCIGLLREIKQNLGIIEREEKEIIRDSLREASQSKKVASAWEQLARGEVKLEGKTAAVGKKIKEFDREVAAIEIILVREPQEKMSDDRTLRGKIGSTFDFLEALFKAFDSIMKGKATILKS